MFIGYVAAAVVTVGNVGVDRRVEVALAADVQAGVIVYIDELGAENALAIVVIEGLMGHEHEQLQELVAARAQRPDLRDGVRIPEHGTIRRVMPPRSTLLSMSRSAEPMPRWGRAFCFSELECMRS